MSKCYGHFSEHLGRCIYGGFWVGEDSAIPNTRGIRNDVVEALRRMKIPVLRWPGGCFADAIRIIEGRNPATGFHQDRTVTGMPNGIIGKLGGRFFCFRAVVSSGRLVSSLARYV